jgi:hypothetical protein
MAHLKSFGKEMNLRSFTLISLFLIAAAYLPAQHNGDIRKVEERERYSIGPTEGVCLEVVVIRWHLDHEMNSTALLRYASLEVAEQRGSRLFGKYSVAQNSEEDGSYVATVFASDDETGRFASAKISGIGREVVTIRVVSWSLTEKEHHIRAGELIERFGIENRPNLQ